MEYYYSRRTLLHTPFSGPSHPATPDDGGAASSAGTAGSSSSNNNSFDANVVMILAVLLCALICALGINSVVRCALRCSSRRAASALVVVDREEEPNHPVAAAAPRTMAQSGLRRKALRAMPVLLYSPGLKLSAANPTCAVCLSDFEAGEHVRVLPKCNHGFHVRCIDRWLLARSTCPTCRQPLFGAPHRASGCSEVSGDVAPPPPPVVHSPVLVPLGPEGLVAPHDS